MNSLPSSPGGARWRHALRQTRLPKARRPPASQTLPEARLALRWFLQLSRRPTPARPNPPEPWWEQARAHPTPNGTWYAPDDDEPPDALPPATVAAR